METILQVIERLELMQITTGEDDHLNLTFEVTLKLSQ